MVSAIFATLLAHCATFSNAVAAFVAPATFATLPAVPTVFAATLAPPLTILARSEKTPTGSSYAAFWNHSSLPYLSLKYCPTCDASCAYSPSCSSHVAASYMFWSVPIPSFPIVFAESTGFSAIFPTADHRLIPDFNIFIPNSFRTPLVVVASFVVCNVGSRLSFRSPLSCASCQNLPPADTHPCNDSKNSGKYCCVSSGVRSGFSFNVAK